MQMKKAFALLVIAALLAAADAPVSPVLCNPIISDYMYDDCTACWITWTGEWRAVAFGDMGCLLTGAELWFYHSSTWPWDTSQFGISAWEWGSSGPGTMTDCDTWSAMHMTAAFAPLYCPADSFWVIMHTGFSSGGWPSVLGDGSPRSDPHSLYSDDFTNWTPWNPGTGSCDYLIRGSSIMWGLQPSTWGSIKSCW